MGRIYHPRLDALPDHGTHCRPHLQLVETCSCVWPYPDHHREAITSRPLLLQAIGRQTNHAGRATVTITSSHGERDRARRALTRIAAFFATLRETAEQLTISIDGTASSVMPSSSISKAANSTRHDAYRRPDPARKSRNDTP